MMILISGQNKPIRSLNQTLAKHFNLELWMAAAIQIILQQILTP